MHHYLAPIIFKAMITFYPIQNHAYHETTEITTNRYESISEDIAEGSAQQPIFSDAEGGAAKTGILLASLARWESQGYDAKVDQCITAGDNGMSWTIFQLMSLFSPKQEVCASRKKAVEWAIKHIKNSFRLCHSLPLQDRLSVYAGGTCDNGRPQSRVRVVPAINFYNTHLQEIQALHP